MSFNYKNPISPLYSLGNISVKRNNVFGTNFSVLSTGGYMEVYDIDDLYFTIPPSTLGLVQYTGNTIPIQFNVGNGTPYSFDVLTLNSDNISSGRRRLGMLAYVIGEDQIYQYQIPNYYNLWTAVTATGAIGPGGPTAVFSDFGTTIKNNSQQGIDFISAWTSNTIEGISGETSSTATWRKFNPISNLSGICYNQIITKELLGCDLSGITLSSDITPNSDNNINLGNSVRRFRDINTVSGTSSYWTSTVKVITPELDLGVDSSGNTRTITANNSVIQDDILNGGIY
jgi:hypothetical protein